MTASLFMTGDLDGRVYITCDQCGKQHTIHAYAITKTRTHAQLRGWQRAGEPGDRRDWCPNCTPPAVEEPAVVEGVPPLFDLHEMEQSAC